MNSKLISKILIQVSLIAVSFILLKSPVSNWIESKQNKANITSSPALPPGTTIWSDNFNNNCAGNCLANTWNGWSVLDNDGGTTGGSPNFWYISCAEEGIAPPGCGSSCIGDASLHIGHGPGSGGDMGAAFNETGATNATFRTAVSPTLSSVGYSDLTLQFDFIAYGSAGCSDDRAQLRLSTDNGATWPAGYQYCLTSVCCGACNGYSQGQWTTYTLSLPAAFNNNPNVRIGINWRNNGNGSGTDPSIAIDDILLISSLCTPPTITSATAGSSPICAISTTTLSANGVAGSNAAVTWWTQSGGTGTQVGSGLTSDPVGPGTYYAYVTGSCTPPDETSVTVQSLPSTIVYNNTCYNTMADAIAAAGNSIGTIYLMSNVGPENLVIPENITLNIANGISYTNTGMLCNNGTIINNGNFTNTGNYKGGGNFVGSFLNFGTINPTVCN